MATRRTFDETDDGGGDERSHQADRRTQYACMAHGCPMTGAIFSGGDGGICAFHHGTHGTDWPRITRTLQDWQCVTDEANACRRTHRNPAMAADGKVLDHLFAQAWGRLEPLLGEVWADELRPGKYPNGTREGYRDWGWRLEKFLTKRVTEATKSRRTERLNLEEMAA